MERFTKKGGLDFTDKNLSLRDEWGYSYIYNRLAELEDKLESGQLVEFPCKIHDTLYTHKKVFGKWKIEEIECWGFHSDGRNILFIDCQNARTASSNSLRAFRVEDFGKTVFTNKSQAKARLKELQEKL